MTEIRLEVTDDSGLLALVVPAIYESFINSDWTLDQVLLHFKSQMARRSLLIWGTGLEGFWKVDIVLHETKLEGFRQICGQIQVVGNAILLTNYESLTMAAQFEDVKLPQKHQQDLLVSLPDGSYACKIIQMLDPGCKNSADDDQPDFVIEIQSAIGKIEAWDDIPWFEL
jgi:hypothetical protein